MKQKPSIGIEDELHLIFNHLSYMLRNGIYRSFYKRLFKLSKGICVFELYFLTDIKQFLLDIVARKRYNLPGLFKIAVIIAVRLYISALGKPCVFVF